MSDDRETNHDAAATVQGPLELRVEKWIYGGDGLSRVGGRVVLTPFVLPDEVALVETSPFKAGTLSGKVVELRAASPHRVEAPCQYFGRCGGCQYQHAPYAYQLAQKVEILRETFRRVGKMEVSSGIRVIAGEPWGYRNRGQFHIERGEIGFRAAGSHRLVPVECCPIASPKVNEGLAALREMLRDKRFPQFLQTVELFTDETETQFNVLASERPPARPFFEWSAEKIPGAAARTLRYPVAGDTFQVGHRSFFQVNRFLVEKLVEAAIPAEGGGAALDLYAGVGLFTLPLARKFTRVTAVESGNGASRDLEFNAARAGAPVRVEHSQADLFMENLTERPDFVLADPPRAGLGKTVVRELLRLKPPRVTIVACEPSTLARDLAPLVAGGYEIKRVTLADLFPQTYHIETVAELSL